MKSSKNKKTTKSPNKDTTNFQQSLDKWFARKDSDGNLIESAYKIFYLDWTNQTANWLPSMPDDSKITYRTTLKWSDLGNDMVHLIGYIPNPIPWDENSNTAPPEGYYTNIAFLKSHLQKAIRRSQTAIALKTANHFFRLDLNDFLRRLAIIMLEDVHLMNSFPIVVWLMAAHSKGFTLDRSQIYWIFGLVYNLAESEWKDEPDFQGYSSLKAGSWKRWPLSKLTSEQKSLIYSLQFRKAFGGLTGDRKMIDVLSQTWVDRYLNQINSTSNKSSEIKNVTDTKQLMENKMWIERLHTIVRFLSPPEEGLELSEWILPAIDFHCMPNILSLLMDKYEEYDYEDIKSTIWHCSSKYNNKIHNIKEPARIEDYRKIWKTIRPQFYSLANYFLTHSY